MIIEIKNVAGTIEYFLMSEIEAVVSASDGKGRHGARFLMRSGNNIIVWADNHPEAEIMRNAMGRNLAAYHAGKYDKIIEHIDPRYIRKMEK